MPVYGWILLLICTFAIGILIGFTVAKKMFKKNLEKNPVVTREQIKAMYMQMGRKPSETQINQAMAAIKRHQK